MKSAIGSDIQMPSRAKNRGNIISKGINNITCLESDKIIELLALPIDRKKFEIIIGKPIIGSIIIRILSP